MGQVRGSVGIVRVRVHLGIVITPDQRLSNRRCVVSMFTWSHP